MEESNCMKLIQETTGAVQASPSGHGRFRVRIISAGVGSSGYYSPDVIKDAVERGVFRKGVHSYMDHPTRTESGDRPERTLRDLVGVLDDDAVWNEAEQAAEVDMKVYAPYRPLLTEMADDIGLSIRAMAEMKPGRVNGQDMPIITQLTEALSVDYVTHAGRGGRVLEVLESATRADAQIHESPEGEQQDHPVTSAGHVGESAPQTIHQEKPMEITEARYAELTAAADRVTALEAAVAAEKQRAEAAEADARKVARDAYTAQVQAAVEASALPAAARERVAAALGLAESADVPADPTQAIQAAIKAEADYLTAVTPAPRKGLGFNAAAEAATEAYTNPWGRTIDRKGA